MGATTLISVGGIVLAGPGSEWFWAMLQFLALAITLVVVFRQLRAARSSNEFAQVREVETEFYSARMTRVRLSLYEDLRDRQVSDGLPDAALEALNWYDNLGYLVTAGHVSARWFYMSWGNSIQMEWWLLAPYIARERLSAPVEPDLHGSFERLAGGMRELDLQEGRAVSFEESDRARLIDGFVRVLRSRLRFAAEPEIPRG